MWNESRNEWYSHQVWWNPKQDKRIENVDVDDLRDVNLYYNEQSSD